MPHCIWVMLFWYLNRPEVNSNQNFEYDRLPSKPRNKTFVS